MAKEKEELKECFKKQYLTPEGVAKFPHLAEPNTRFVKGGKYEVRLYFDDEAGAKLLAMLQEAYDEAIEIAKEKYKKMNAQSKANNPFSPQQFYKEEVLDDGTSTGRIFIHFDKLAKLELDDGRVLEFEVPVFDKANKPMTQEDIKKASGGSTMRAAFKVKPYFMPAGAKAGISIGLEAVQIIKAVEYTRDAESYGFTAYDESDDEDFASAASPAGEKSVKGEGDF